MTWRGFVVSACCWTSTAPAGVRSGADVAGAELAVPAYHLPPDPAIAGQHGRGCRLGTVYRQQQIGTGAAVGVRRSRRERLAAREALAELAPPGCAVKHVDGD